MEGAAIGAGIALGASVISGGFALGTQAMANNASASLANRAEESFTSQGLPSYMAYGGGNNIPTMRYQVAGQNIASSAMPFFVTGAPKITNSQQQATGAGRAPQIKNLGTLSKPNNGPIPRYHSPSSYPSENSNFNLYGDVSSTNVKGMGMPTYLARPFNPKFSNVLQQPEPNIRTSNL